MFRFNKRKMKMINLSGFMWGVVASIFTQYINGHGLESEK